MNLLRQQVEKQQRDIELAKQWIREGTWPADSLMGRWAQLVIARAESEPKEQRGLFRKDEVTC